MTTQTKINKAILHIVGRATNQSIKTHEDIRSDHNLFDDIGADSLEHIEIVMALEEEFDTEVPDDDAEKWQTVGDIYLCFESEE